MGEGKGVGCLPGCCPSLTILVRLCSSIVGCHVAVGDVAPTACVKKGEEGEVCYLPLCCPYSFVVVIEHPLLVATSLLATWPLLLVCEQKRREKS